MDIQTSATPQLIQTIGQAGGQSGHAGAPTEAGSFAQILVGSVNKPSSEEAVDPAELTMNALLEGLSPALLALLFPEQNASADPSAAAEKLTALLQSNPETAAKLAELPGVQIWMKQAEQLLQSAPAAQMTPSLETAPVTDHKVPVANVGTPMDGDQVKHMLQLLTRLTAALKQEPDSILFKQLAEQFQALVKPVLSEAAAATTNGGERESMPQMAASENKTSMVQRKHPFVRTENASVVPVSDGAKSEADAEANPLVAILRKPSDKLEILAARTVPLQWTSAVSDSAQTEQAADAQTSAPDMTASITAPIADSPKSAPLLSEKAMVPSTPQTFVKDMQQLVLKAFNLNTGNGISEARLTLNPESLGQVDVKITIQNGQMVAHFAAQNLSGKEMLESQLPHLRQNLQSLGLQVERLVVTQNTGLQSGMFHDQRQQHSQQSFSQANRGRYTDNGLNDDEFAAEFVQLQRLRTAAFGSTVDVTA